MPVSTLVERFTYQEAVTLAGSPGALCRLLGLNKQNATYWRRIGFVPAKHTPALMAALEATLAQAGDGGSKLRMAR